MSHTDSLLSAVELRRVDHIWPCYSNNLKPKLSSYDVNNKSGEAIPGNSGSDNVDVHAQYS